MSSRKQYRVTVEDLEFACRELLQATKARIAKHGDLTFAGDHDGLGVTTEEFWELVQAVQSNNPVNVKKEAMDVAVCGLWMVVTQNVQEENS